jgi:hypothetical protein
MLSAISAFSSTITNTSLEIWGRFLEIIYSPFNFRDMLWILIPLLLTMLLIEFYFGFYVEEELGWNTAFGNALVLMFIGLDLGRHLYENNVLFKDDIKTIIVIAVLIEAALIAFFDFFHVLPERFAFKISGTLPINFIAITAIILVYASIPIDFMTISALFLLLIVLSIGIGIIHFIEPKQGNKHYLDDKK